MNIKHVWKKPVNYQHLIHDKTFAGIVNDSSSDKYLLIHSWKNHHCVNPIKLWWKKHEIVFNHYKNKIQLLILKNS